MASKKHLSGPVFMRFSFRFSTFQEIQPHFYGKPPEETTPQDLAAQAQKAFARQPSQEADVVSDGPCAHRLACSPGG
ncbi:MAG: hypothetical protein ACLFR7_04800 [Opitutales bacterium]